MRPCVKCDELNKGVIFFEDYDLCEDCAKEIGIKSNKELDELFKSQRKPNIVTIDLDFK